MPKSLGQVEKIPTASGSVLRIETWAFARYCAGMKSLTDYAQKFDKLRDNCPVKAAIDVIRGRWKPSILWELSRGTKRFSDLQTALPDCRAQVLTVQLRQLEADGVITRTIFPEIPVRVEYALTTHGNQLSSVMDQLDDWGTRHLKRQGKAAASPVKR